jgi:hypothetical protein
MNAENPMQQPKTPTSIFTQEVIISPSKSGAWKWMLPLAILLTFCVCVAWTYGWHAKAVTASIVLLAVLSHVFSWVLGIISLVPIVGPLIVKVLSLSIIWLLNAVGYLVSFVAIKRGYSQDVITYRALTVALIIGIVVGFVIGSLL